MIPRRSTTSSGSNSPLLTADGINLAAVVTLAAVAGAGNIVDGLIWSYDAGGTLSGGRITVRDGAARTVTDGVTATNTTITSATAAFTSADIGRTISGTSIVTGTKITAVGSATSVTVSPATTATAGGVSITIDPVLFDMDITSAGAGFLPIRRKGSVNTAMTVTLAAGGSGVTGKMNLADAWAE